jgi:hypothetical protein
LLNSTQLAAQIDFCFTVWPGVSLERWNKPRSVPLDQCIVGRREHLSGSWVALSGTPPNQLPVNTCRFAALTDDNMQPP